MTQLKIKKGQFSEHSFAQLFWQICKKERSGVLTLSRNQVEKQIHFNNGIPTFVESNLLHETIAAYLVEHGMITADQQQEALLKSIEKKERIGSTLISLGMIDAMSFYRALKKNQAAKILECFRWEDGSYLFDVDATPNLDLSLKMNPYRLILHGVLNVLPIEQINRDASFDAQQPFRIASHKLPQWTEKQLSTNETRILNQLRSPAPIGLVCNQLSIDQDAALRRLYAFYLMDIVIISNEPLPEQKPEPAAKPAQESLPADVKQTSKPSNPCAQSIARLSLKLADLNFFELLELPESATGTEVRNHFLKFAAENNPGNFDGMDQAIVDQAESVFLKGVEAFHMLKDFDRRQDYLKKIRSKARMPERKAATHKFTIKTDLLDASSQYKLGMKFLKAEQYIKATEHFEFAYDVDPKPRYLAYLGWSKFLANPATGLDDLNQALKLDPEDLEIKRLLRKSQAQIESNR